MLLQPRFGLLDDHGVHCFNDFRSAPHEADFGLAFYRPLPVHQARDVLKLGIRQVVLQRLVGGGGEIVIVHFHTDPPGAPATLGDEFSHGLVRMPLRRLHEVVRQAKLPGSAMIPASPLRSSNMMYS